MTQSHEKIQNIIIIGGGSSGWMSAAYLAKSLNFTVNISLIESPQLDRIGVGEATVPTIQSQFFNYLGIPEEEWMVKCQATYKLGVKFLNWKRPPEMGGDHYYHNFGEIPSINEVPLTHIWIKKRLEENFPTPMAYACFSSLIACDLNKSPKFYDGTRVHHHYAYHFDALRVADFLKDWSVARGVQHIRTNLATAELDTQGNIRCVVGDDGEKYYADLFIDCSGFHAFLIEKILQEPVITFDDSLLTDRAVAINIPEDSAHDGIRPYTSATAFKAGWLWEIPLFYRSGNGYVYSSQFMSDAEAEHEIRTFFGKKVEKLPVRFIKFQSRRRRNAWVNNCVSIGLANSFLEPLESTGIYFIYAALYQLVENFPNKCIDPVYRDKFNDKVRYMVEDVKDFIVMHFKTAQREDTPFWLANKHETKIPDSLQLILERQKSGLPIHKSHKANDELYTAFSAQFENFWTNSNYQCILCGVHYLPNTALPLLQHRDDIMQKAELLFQEIAAKAKQYGDTLPTQYDYLRYLYGKSTLPEALVTN